MGKFVINLAMSSGWHASYFSAEGDIDRNLSRLAVSLANAAEELEPNSGETPTIVLDSQNT